VALANASPLLSLSWSDMGLIFRVAVRMGGAVVVVVVVVVVVGVGVGQGRGVGVGVKQLMGGA
jgi:hypothetical protein